MKQEKLEQRLGIAKRHATSKDGLCLSTEYNNNTEHMTWKCANETHKSWGASYRKVVNCGTWCPKCSTDIANIKRHRSHISATERLEIAHTYAKTKNGECLTTTPITTKELVLWKCENMEHKSWSAKYHAVTGINSWCPECSLIKRAKSKTTAGALDIAKAHAKNLGGECLSTEYISARDNLIWHCGNSNHKPWNDWYDTVIRQGYWCTECSCGLDVAKTYAISKGGECLSSEYIHCKAKMIWKCSNIKHNEWNAEYSSIVNNKSWCPECGKNNISENRVRAIFETFFNLPFPSVRPTWNINPWTYRTLELDGYCKEFNIAFEHDGEHHFSINKFSDKFTNKDLIYQQFKDEQKKKNCRNNEILLINIPILESKYRNDFDAVLKNVINHCNKYDLQMSFTDEQINELKNSFNKGE